MNDVKVKQQIVDKIKASTNILVTVSNDPSVDALSAALGLTLMLNKVGKHATAVFSGAIPPAITFLDPEKTFEATTDSLQDFIIALDKEKADHLRYKVEGDVVKIFITPYRTTITSDDLEFSQGDYNVELVLALGVDNQDHLDGALEAQGRILHDATVATLSAGDQTSTLGSLDWQESGASSLSEMLVGLAELLKTEKDKEPLLDAQTATALLTGIVAETDRFSNTKTSSKVMTVAAQLMAAGADQQLIAAKLEESHEIGVNTTVADEPTHLKIDKKVKEVVQEPSDTMSIIHTQGQTLEDIANQVHEHDQAAAAVTAEQAVADLPKPVETPVVEAPELPAISVTNAYAPEPEMGAIEAQPMTSEPSLGGTLNATTEQAAEDARKEQESDQNKTILSHAYLSESPTNSPPMNSETIAPDAPSNDIFAPTPEVTPLSTPTDALLPPSESVGETRDDATRQDALAAVHATFDATPAPAAAPVFSPAPGITLPPPPPLPDFSAMSATSAYAPEPMPTAAPEILGDIFPDPQASQVPPATGPSDPAQFKIPGQ